MVFVVPAEGDCGYGRGHNYLRIQKLRLPMAKASKKDAQDIARLSSDCSFLLTHIIRQNGETSRTDIDANGILEKILEGKCLKASKVGWYNTCDDTNYVDPKTNTIRKPNLAKAVCFTESTLAGLRAHAVVFKAKYGLSFDRDYLFSKGANPCLNISGSLLKAEIQRNGERFSQHVYNFIPEQLHPFVNIINEAFDATHEREWRHLKDLHFDFMDVKFLFCPEEDFPIFSGYQQNGKPSLFDLAWLDRV